MFYFNAMLPLCKSEKKTEHQVKGELKNWLIINQH